MSHDQTQTYSTVHLEPVFERLDQSAFRSSFKLGEGDLRYVSENQFSAILEYAARLVKQSLGSAIPANDGKQTPMRGHPVYVAQHATATCCRACLAKWHGISKGVKLEPRQINYVTAVIEHWICREANIPFNWREDVPSVVPKKVDKFAETADQPPSLKETKTL